MLLSGNNIIYLGWEIGSNCDTHYLSQRLTGKRCMSKFFKYPLSNPCKGGTINDLQCYGVCQG